MPEASDIRLPVLHAALPASLSAPELRPGARPAPPPGTVCDEALPEGDNIVPFRRPGLAGPERTAAAAPVEATHRPAPRGPERSRAAVLVVAVAVSFAVHAGLYSVFSRPAPPLASIGLESMSVELVLGTDSAAGRAATPSPEESEPAREAKPAGSPDGAEATPAPEIVRPAETAALDTPVEPARDPVAAPADTPADTPPADTPPVATAPPEPIPAPVTETAALPPEPAAAEPRKPAPAPARAAEKPRPAVRPPATAKPRGENGKDTRVAVAAPSAGASGLGIGRSDAHSNYPGLVAAHLARFKRFPAEARQQGNGGVATVRFMLDGGGRVTSVALVAGSGNPALDRESVEVVRRASPFPAPPDGRPRGFSQPIRFNVR